MGKERHRIEASLIEPATDLFWGRPAIQQLLKSLSIVHLEIKTSHGSDISAQL